VRRRLCDHAGRVAGLPRHPIGASLPQPTGSTGGCPARRKARSATDKLLGFSPVLLIGAEVLPGKISVKGLRRLRRRAFGAPLMVIFRGKRMPGARRTARPGRGGGHRAS
jgi:hypothetical protein